MLLKSVFNRKLGRSTSIYFKKWRLSLHESELTAVALNEKCWCMCENRNFSKYSHFLSGKNSSLVKFSVVTFSTSSPVKPKKEQFFKHVDQVSENFSLIYKAAIDDYVVFGRRFTSICYVFLFGVGIAKAYYLLPLLPIDFEVIPKPVPPENSFITSDVDFFTYFSSALVFALAIQSTLSKFPMRLYHNPTNDEYIAIFSNYMGNPTKLPFNKGDVKKLEPTGFLPWKDNRYSIQSKKVILMEHYFRLPADYNALLGLEASDDSSEMN